MTVNRNMDMDVTVELVPTESVKKLVCAAVSLGKSIRVVSGHMCCSLSTFSFLPLHGTHLGQNELCTFPHFCDGLLLRCTADH